MLKDKKYKVLYLGNNPKIKKLILNSKLDRMETLNKNNVVLFTIKLKKILIIFLLIKFINI